MTLFDKFAMFFSAEITQLLLFLWFVNFVLGNIRAAVHGSWTLTDCGKGIGLLLLFLTGYFVAWFLKNSPAAANIPSWLSVSGIEGAGLSAFVAAIYRNISILTGRDERERSMFAPVQLPGPKDPGHPPKEGGTS